MGVDDIFGGHPNRPEHKDFWRLSAIILGMDASTQGREGHILPEEEGAEAFRRSWDGHADLGSVTYMARQRALRGMPLLIQHPGDVRALEALLSALWMEGFRVGIAFKESLA